jgi:hypothetical protein
MLFKIGFRGLEYLPSVGRNIFDYEWDACVVLDACRYDLFEEFACTHEVSQYFQEIEPAWSLASRTPDWIPRTFGSAPDDILNDTVYVVDNGHSTLIPTDSPVKLDEVWRYASEDGSWLVDESIVTDRALHHLKTNESERLLVHYTVPHAPFRHKMEYYSTSDDSLSSDVWNGLESGEFEYEDVWKDYGQNLLRGLNEVDKLVKAIDGKILLTSDHGNLMGEYGQYGHIAGLFPPVRRVPWVWVEGQGTTAPSELQSDCKTPTTETANVEDNLSALGYK